MCVMAGNVSHYPRNLFSRDMTSYYRSKENNASHSERIFKFVVSRMKDLRLAHVARRNIALCARLSPRTLAIRETTRAFE